MLRDLVRQKWQNNTSSYYSSGFWKHRANYMIVSHFGEGWKQKKPHTSPLWTILPGRQKEKGDYSYHLHSRTGAVDSSALAAPKTTKHHIFCFQRLSKLLTGTASHNMESLEVLQHFPALLCPCRCWSRNNTQEKNRTVAACKIIPKEERLSGSAHNPFTLQLNLNPEGCLFFVHEWIP